MDRIDRSMLFTQKLHHAMSILTNDSPSFAITPTAAAAGSEARMAEAGLVHGAAPKEDSLKLEDAARLIRDTAAKLWAGSKAVASGLWQMLVNFFRWITRPFRAGQANGTGAPADGQGAGAGSPADVNRMTDGPEGDADSNAPGEALGADGGKGIPEDYLGQDQESDTPVPGLKKPVKFAFPAGFAGKKPEGDLPLGADTIVGAMKRLNEKVPDLSAVDESKLPVIAAIGLLEQCVSDATQAMAHARSLDVQINTQLVALAALSDTPADQLLAQVLASDELGGLPGAEIRRMHAERVACEQRAASLQRTIESSLMNVKQQGLDVVEIATLAKVDEALPDWRAKIALPGDQAPAALTPAERRELALDVDPELEVGPTEPSPQRVASLKAALNSNVSNDNEHEHENDRPRG
ncbi:hypothetical protein [Variovorax ginsengisoli]|uniref:Uncharacterized protein n=1 Tax=Variovorax ginsengisoli TaxID=363844 RepID=A0ABT8S9R6_9BURK|nr:hypothetical protein [Variovorax ginsengisoli]MDN8616492.1 hypothetical protein [Variovorax ginsengisoli]MDO1535662.1 hypothetical protein [Variovorax ginsengisoli]